MDTSKLKKFAQYARRSLMEQVTAKLKRVLAAESPARRERPEVVAKLEERIRETSGKWGVGSGKSGPESWSWVIEEVAYTWFNRFCALRFMDVNGYNRIGVVSPAVGQFQPEILAEAKMGYVDEAVVPAQPRQQILALLDGTASSPEPQAEAYRLLVVAVCNDYHRIMPYLFERIDDYTELLMPDDLLSGNSILAYTREAMTPEACGVGGKVGSGKWEVGSKEEEKSATLHSPLSTSHSAATGGVEVIGWLYQFYISEKKDEVFAALKKNKKITPENIPAATQLFTPNWIVRYLVENSLGRLWLLNRPSSKLIEQMDYYIKPVESGKWEVGSGEGLRGDGQELSGVDCLAEGDVSGGGGTQPTTSRRNQTDDSRPSQQIILNLSPTSHSPLPTSHLKISSPEEIKICDPACGSGHMLTYAFDLLYAIYEEEGYEPSEIPEKILTHNLYGIEIDERAGELAAFALTMKAREKQRRFFRKPVQPNICVLESIRFEDGELEEVGSGKWEVGSDGVGSSSTFHSPLSTTHSPLSTLASRDDLLHDLHLFREADNFGSLLRPRLTSEQCQGLIDYFTSHSPLSTSHSLFENFTQQKILKVLRQADFLSAKYHVVVANPPYMGGKGMNGQLGAWVKDNYPVSKSDLFAVFMERIMEFVPSKGLIGLMTPFTWMFLSSYEKLRLRILNENTLTTLVRPEYHAFFDSAYVPICAFTLSRQYSPDYKGAFIDLQKFYGADLQPVKALEAIKNPDCGWFYRASAGDFNKIPGSPIAYWVSKNVISVFKRSIPLSKYADIGKGLDTGNNERFLRLWHETSGNTRKWIPCQKGGSFRKWYGNNEYIINWENDGKELKNFAGSNLRNSHNYFKKGLSWTRITSSKTAFRFFPEGNIFESTGPCLFPKDANSLLGMADFLNSKLAMYFLQFMSPTLDFQSGHISNLPILDIKWKTEKFIDIGENCISLSKIDWDSYETSWDFTRLPLLEVGSEKWKVGSKEETLSTLHSPLSTSLRKAYTKLRAHWQNMTLEMQRLEEENNRIFIEAYGLQDELTPDVPLNEITLTCNPHYRYGVEECEVGSEKWEEMEARLLADTMKEFISYAVGCMFGRYSLDKPGLILANQGETLEDYLQQVPKPSFMPDKDNVIPILDGDWFPDDISEQLRQFLRQTFGEENYAENLKFLENAIGKDIRKYFLRDFYTDHLKRYKKRPIYWLFSSPKGTFNALIYMHRYRPDTVSIVLNDYLREFRTKLIAEKAHLEHVSISETVAAAAKTKALKDIEALNKAIQELDTYERDILYPLATEKLEIDLDDGVKVNYPKFGKALKPIPGLT